MSLLGRYLVSLALIAVAGLAWFGERFVVRQRVAALADLRLDRLQADLAAVDASVARSNTNGDYFRFLGARPGKDLDASQLNPRADLVESAVLLDRNYSTIARSGRDLTGGERGISKVNAQKNLLTDTALIRRYVLTDFDGKGLAHLALLIRPDLKSSHATLFALPFDRSLTAAFSRDIFNQEEKKLVSVLLAAQSDRLHEFSIRGRRLASVRRALMPENLIFYEVVALPPIYGYFSTYFLILVVLGSLLFMWRGFAAQRYTRRELSERTLHSFKTAIGAREQQIDVLARLTESDDSIKEKLVSAVDKEAEIEERIAAAQKETAKPAESAALVIDIMPERRQFRFMNPARVVSAPQRADRLNEGERKIRERAFSAELKGLMDELAQPAGAAAPAGEADLLREIEGFESAHKYPPIDQYLYYLNELYFDDVTPAELAEALRVAGDAVQSQSFALLLYDAAGAYFKTAFVHAAPESLKNTFFLLVRDSILPNDFTDYGYVPATAQLKKNAYFRKRLPADFAEALKGVHVFSISESYLRARIVFFDTARGGEIADAGVLASIRAYLRQLAPAVHMYIADQTSDAATGDARNLAVWSVKELRESIRRLEDGSTWISQYVFESGLKLDEQLSLMSDISRHLEAGEKVIMFSPARIAVVHRQGAAKIIEERVGRVGKKFIVKESEFGKASRNLYTFAEF